MKSSLELELIETKEALLEHISHLSPEDFAIEFLAVPLHVKILYNNYLKESNMNFQKETKNLWSDANFIIGNYEKIEQIMGYNSFEKSYEKEDLHIAFPKQ